MTTSAPTAASRAYRRWGRWTCWSVFLLFLFGGLVRATGSGMGCPDWPKCYGGLAPPLSESALPSDYREVFVAKRLLKVEKFAVTLERFGFAEKARYLREHPMIDMPEHFDAVKAWIEYVNRLFGVLAGIFALLFLGVTLRHADLRRHLPWGLVGFAFLLLNGWLGSVVVATNLIPGIVSLHFLLAFLCLFGYLKALHSERPFAWCDPARPTPARVWVLFGVTWVVVTLGTWARESIEHLRFEGRLSGPPLDVGALGVPFLLHRWLPALICAAAGIAWWRSRHRGLSPLRPWVAVAVVALLQIGLGAIHILHLVPVWTQIAHVVLGSGLLTLLFVWALGEGARDRGAPGP